MSIKNTPPLDWSYPESHESRLIEQGPVSFIHRTIDATRYTVVINAPVTQIEPHVFRIAGDGTGNTLDFSVQFLPGEKTAPVAIPSYARLLLDSAAHWEEFWDQGAALDFSGSTHPLAQKLEERIVLSLYLMAVQMAGGVPPQESGLAASTWYGKHHTEMIWWNTAHFALWGHDELLEKNLDWYRAHLPEARALAASRGLKGARWAKMVGPDDRESPGGNPLIVWNQPHLIYLCELLYQNRFMRDQALAKYRDLVLETADALASMVNLNETKGRYELGPPLWIAQEIYDPATSQNPAFELSYWRWALGVAQQWRERLGMARDKRWDDIIARLSPPPVKDGKYVALESNPDTWDNVQSRQDHPSMLMPLGFLPGGPDVDRETMARTLDAVLKTWDWEAKIWGWDYPMIAMTAAKLGRFDQAIEILLRDGPNNRYLPNGYCPQKSGDRPYEIAAYLPANGAFLSAVAMMFSGHNGKVNPGALSLDGWKVRMEGHLHFPEK
jgi:hypothetical protein